MIPNENDAELVRQMQCGRPAAFEQLTRRYYRPVAAFILKRVQHADLVDDLTQETFLEAFQALKRGVAPQRFSSWLFGIAHNRCGKWLRRRRPILFTPEQERDLPATATEQELREEVEEQEKLLAQLDGVLQGLPEELRQMLHWKHRDGKTCAQIAADTGKPVNTVKSLLARTYQTLRAALSPAPGK